MVKRWNGDDGMMAPQDGGTWVLAADYDQLAASERYFIRPLEIAQEALK